MIKSTDSFRGFLSISMHPWWEGLRYMEKMKIRKHIRIIKDKRNFPGGEAAKEMTNLLMLYRFLKAFDTLVLIRYC